VVEEIVSMKRLSCHATTAAALAFCLAGAGQASAASLILNGGFESGLASWTTADQIGSDGTFSSQAGTASPVNSDAVPAPPQGTNAAMTDAQGPGSHVLYQDFVVSSPGGILSFDLFIGNRAPDFFTADPSIVGLDFGTPELNQQARVDIMKSNADPFSVAASDLLQNLVQTDPGDPLVSGYNSFNIDLSGLFAANQGETLRLRFAEVDNVFTFQLGVDNVNIEAVPEPASLVLLGTGLAAIGARRRRA
jgi:hypothetical protein